MHMMIGEFMLLTNSKVRGEDAYFMVTTAGRDLRCLSTKSELWVVPYTVQLTANSLTCLLTKYLQIIPVGYDRTGCMVYLQHFGSKS